MDTLIHIIKYATWVAMILGPLGSALIGIYPRNRLLGYTSFALASLIWMSYGIEEGLYPLAITSLIYVVIEIISAVKALKSNY